MPRMRLHLSIVWIPMLLAPVLGLAHHSNAYRSGEPILWMGSIAKVSWDGAHVMYMIEVPNADGSTRQWQALGASPYRLGKRGIRKSTLKVGEVVGVAGYLNRANAMITPVYLARGGEKFFVGYDSSDAGFAAPPASLPE